MYVCQVWYILNQLKKVMVSFFFKLLLQLIWFVKVVFYRSLLLPEIIIISSIPDFMASSTIYWIVGLSTIGSISLGCAFVAGRNLVPDLLQELLLFWLSRYLHLSSSFWKFIDNFYLSEKNIISNIYSKVFFIHTYIFVIVCKHNIDYKFSVYCPFSFYTVKKFAGWGMNTVIVKTI